MPQMVVDTKAVEPMIVMKRTERKSAGLFIIRNLDNRCQNYAKLKFNTKFILASNGFQLFDLIMNTAGTGLWPSLSEGLIVSFPLISIQLLPPPSRFKASTHPIFFNSCAS